MGWGGVGWGGLQAPPLVPCVVSTASARHPSTPNRPLHHQAHPAPWLPMEAAAVLKHAHMLTPVTPPPRRCDPPTRESVPLTIGIRDHGRHRRMAEGSRCRHRHRHCVVRAWRWNGPFGASGTRESAMLTPVTPPPRRCDPPTRESVPLTIGFCNHGRHRRMVEGSCWCHRHRHCVVRAWRWNGPYGASGTRESAPLRLRSLHLHEGATHRRESQSH